MSEDFYSRVQRRMWNDAGFRKLSKPAPNARDLFLYLLTTPHATQVPGLIALGESAMAEDLEWPVPGLRKALAELESSGMVRVDRSARLLWLPNGLKHNPPKSPTNIQGWARYWRMLPECDLLREAAEAMMQAFLARKGGYAAAFAVVAGLPVPDAEAGPEGGAKPPPKTVARPACQEQDQEKEQESHTHPRAPAREDEGEGDAETVPLPKCTEADIEALLCSVPALTALADDPDAVTDLHSGFLMACMDGATIELAREAIGAVVAAENLREMSPSQQRERVGRYLSNARKYSRGSDRGSSPRTVTPDMRVVLAVFGEVWEARKRRPYVQAVGDEKHAATLVEAAWEHAGKLKMRPRDIVRHWADQYLGDADKFVSDPEHPLRLLPSRLTTYGLPSGPAKKRPSESPQPAAPLVPPPDLVAALDSAARGPRPRPGTRPA